jgi:hypothetical protein
LAPGPAEGTLDSKPALVGWFVVDLRAKLSAKGIVLSATPKAWDEFFGRLARLPDDASVGLVVTLSDGRKVGGFWSEAPFASSFPNDEDLLISVPITIDQTSGQFRERATSSRGVLLKRDDIIMIEAFDGAAVIGAAAESEKRNPHESSLNVR